MQPEAAPAPQPTVAWRLRLRLPAVIDAPIALVEQVGGTVVEVVPAADGPRLRCRVALVPPEALIARRRAAGHTIGAAMAAGEMALEAPLAGARGIVAVTLRLRPERLELRCDGVLMDEEWPFTPRRGDGAPTVLRPDLVESVSVVADADEPAADAATTARWLPDTRPFGAYWRPAGHNASAGDTMLCARGDELHLFWLHDRRWHHSKWGIGAHQFDHASTTDLCTWRRLPRAARIDEPWMTVGTGSCIHDGERFHLFWHNHGERFGTREGMFVSTSADGAAFAIEPGWNRHDVIQPGVWREGGRWRLLSDQRLYESTDLRDWRLVDDRFIERPAGVSEECPSVFARGDRFWLIIGRAGCWTWRSGEKPRPCHAYAPYDGLMVPMATAWRERLILAGWVVDDATAVGHAGSRHQELWGGTLVFRELVPHGADGLRMRWVPELIPAGGAWSRALAPTALADGGRAAFAIPAGAAHLRLAVEADADLAVIVGGDADGVGGTEIRLEASARRLLTTRAPNGPFSGIADQPAHRGRDFALAPVEDLAATRTIDVLLWPDRGGVIVDVQLDCGRTLVARHAGAWGGGAVVATRGGAARISAEVRTLQR